MDVWVEAIVDSSDIDLDADERQQLTLDAVCKEVQRRANAD